MTAESSCAGTHGCFYRMRGKYVQFFGGIPDADGAGMLWFRDHHDEAA